MMQAASWAMHGGAIEFSTVDDLDSDSEFLQAFGASTGAMHGQSGSTSKDTVKVDESASAAERKSHSSSHLGKPHTPLPKS